MRSATSDRSRVRRHAERGRYDAETVHAILDAGIVGHLAFLDGAVPIVVPMLYARNGHELYLHGSPQSRVLGLAREGARLCVTVTHVDGLVLARSHFHHSVNYRSVVVMGAGRLVEEREEKLEAMRLLVEHIVPGRAADSRGPSDGELKATEMVAMAIEEASAKVRTGPPIDTNKDLELPHWAGVLPLRIEPGQPVAEPGCDGPVPEYVRSWGRRDD